MPTKKHPDIIAMSAPVTIEAASIEGEESQGPPKFSVIAYTGGQLQLNGWDQPVVVDLEGLDYSNSLIANMDHDTKQRVGHVTESVKADGKLLLSGIVSAATPAANEVISNAKNGFPWQASIEAGKLKLEPVRAKQTVEVNGQTFTGPLYVARKATLKGFAFVSHGADDNTSVTIAATAASNKEKKMNADCKKWIEAMGLDVDTLSAEVIANLEADFEGREGKRTIKAASTGDALEAKALEAERRRDIKAMAEAWCDQALETGRYDDVSVVRQKRDEAIEAGMSLSDFKYELKIATLTNTAPTIHTGVNKNVNNRVLEAAVCMTGNLQNHEQMFDDQTLQAAHDTFKHGISLGELLIIAARANGYHGAGSKVTLEVQRAAFGQTGHGRQIHASGGYSTLSIPDVLSNVANKFIREGWMHVDQAWRKISAIRTVTDFKQTTTVSLTGGLMFEQLGPDGHIKHGEIGNETYTNQADTYAKMFAITRKDIINDDLNALTAVPRRLGRGGALKLNDLFWREFLDPSVPNFFHANNGNVSTDDGTLGLTGLDQAYVIFMNQTDPDGTPLGSEPKILLVPTALATTARQLMTSEKIKGDTDEADANVWRGRFEVVTSPYLSNAAYTGNSSFAWYLLADPNDIPVIEVAALNGRVEPTVDTADADFNTLGIQMRGYSDVGVKVQEPRGGVRADGSAADGS